MNRLAILASHPVQYYAPLFRELARRCEVRVFYAHVATPDNQAAAGFGTAFQWDVDLTSGYQHTVLRNIAKQPGTDRFSGCDTPEIGVRLRECRFDAVLALGWHLKSMLQGVWAARQLGMRTLVRGDSHLATPRSLLKTWVKSLTYPRLLRAFDAALYVGARNRAYYDHYQYPSDRLFHSPHCVDTERFAAGATGAARAALRGRFGIADDEHVLLFAGKLVPFKRPIDVVEAAAQLRANDFPVRVLIAGSGPLETEVRTCAAALRVPLDILGFVNQSGMPAAYAASDVLCLPSDGRETWGLVCNEAIASGRPIVVSETVGCAPDLAADRNVGRTFKLGDTDGLVAAIAETISRPPSHSCLSRVAAAFSLKAAADGIEDALGMVTE